MAAGLKTLELISAPGFYDQLTATTTALLAGLQVRADAAGIPFSTNQVGGMFGLFFTSEKVTNYEQATACNQEQFKAFFHGMLERGVYLAPSAFEAGFVSIMHGEAEIQTTLDAAAATFAAMTAG
jgi:glutamate-1-semialdehyde 2,1-aminomutase